MAVAMMSQDGRFYTRQVLKARNFPLRPNLEAQSGLGSVLPSRTWLKNKRVKVILSNRP